ncbi:MAG: long-chain-fatty-acid--CoA ligase [Gemmobacter sp.]|nr:long-chain-fatty-acid--CoA ligase [Gemmobacter sp.]
MTTDTFASLIRAHAAARPDAPALTFEARTQRFGDLHAASSRIAQLLAAHGVGAGDRVAMLSRNRAEFFQVIIAASKLGAVVVGLNWRLSPREIGEILADADPAVLIVDDTGAALVQGLAVPYPVLAFGAGFDAMVAAQPDTDPGHTGAPDEVALILYTSGTTGRPKGVMLTNRGMSYTRQLAREWGMSEQSVNLVAMPLFHIGGCGYGSSTMMAGGHTVLMPEVRVPDILALIPQYRVTHTFLVPSVVQMLLNAPEVDGADLSSLQLLMYGAAPMGDVLLRRAITVLGCNFMHAYGMTESSGTVAILRPDAHDPDGPNPHLLKSCGRAMPWVELRVMDAEGEPAPAGTTGELWIRSPMLMAGYWRNPQATAAAITPDGWFRSADAAQMDSDGHVFLIDRMKDMIISGGENIYPAEIENVLNGHPAVAQVGVIGVPHDRWGETPLAAVVLRPGTQATEDDLRAYTRANLATYKCPSRFIFVPELPRNASGKLLKPEMRRLWGTGA